MINVQIDVDPNNGFEGISKEALFRTTGMIPMFIQDTALSRPESALDANHFHKLQSYIQYHEDF